MLSTIPWDEDSRPLSVLRERTGFFSFDFLRKGNSRLRLSNRLLKEHYSHPAVGASPPSELIYEAMDLATGYAAGRKLITTAKGYLGLGTSLARKGDAICILRGCSMPVILRPVVDGTRCEDATRWTLVGECYVHGIMDGEATEFAEADPSITRTFEIC